MNKIKAFVKSVWESIKGHPFSIGAFLLGALCIAIKPGNDYVVACSEFFFVITSALLMVEALYEYWEVKLEGKFLTMLKRRGVYGLAVAVSAVFSAYEAYESTFKSYYCIRFLGFYMIFTCCVAFYLFYKLNEMQFELYCVRFFGGVMKTLLVCIIMVIGVTFIIYAFEELIFSFGGYDVFSRVQAVLMGLVYFPCFVSEISKVKGIVTKFAKVIINYVFTALLSIAFLIVYIYIIKIVVTMTIPSNEVFTILSMLFCGGICIWTMAQGICEDKMKKIFTYYPFAFVPFIILQIISLNMRVSAYGYTSQRYFGLALIVFEIVYFAIYAYSVFAKKNIMWVLVVQVVVFAFFTLAAPITNIEAVIIASQKVKIEKFLADSSGENAVQAHDAYDVIEEECGKLGKKYLASIDEKMTEEQDAMFKNCSIEGVRENIVARASVDRDVVNVEGYKSLYVFDDNFSDYYFIEGSDNTEIKYEDLAEYQIRISDSYVETVDIRQYIMDLVQFNGSEECDKYIEEHPLETPSGAVIYFNKVYVDGYGGENYSEDNKEDMVFYSIELSGFVLQ